MIIEIGETYISRNNDLIRITAKDDKYYFGFLITNNEDLKGVARAFHPEGMSTYNSDWSLLKKYKEPFRDEFESIFLINPLDRTEFGFRYLTIFDSNSYSEDYKKELIRVKAKVILEEIID